MKAYKSAPVYNTDPTGQSEFVLELNPKLHTVHGCSGPKAGSLQHVKLSVVGP